MKSYRMAHLSDPGLLAHLDVLDARDFGTTAELLACLGEVDARKLYLPAGYPSMYTYCVGHRKYSEDVAYKRIRAARAARRFPAILELLADGRLHLSGVVLLAPFLTEDTAAELLASSVHKTKAEIELLLAARFPRPDVPELIRPIATSTYACQLAPGPVGLSDDRHVPPPAEPATDGSAARAVPAQADPTGTQAADGQPMEPIAPSVPRPRLTPLAPGRFGLQVPIDQETHDLLRYAQALLSHVMPPSDLAAVLKRVVQEGIGPLEHQRFAATEQPQRGGRRMATEGRHIPAEVKRTVWKRDDGRCTFVSETGVRCPEEAWLQFDHVDPYARGGEASAANIRLRCHGHNQLEAERTFGAEFMRHKRIAAAEKRANRRRTMGP